MPNAKDFVTTKDAEVPTPIRPPPGVDRTLTPFGEWVQNVRVDPSNTDGFLDSVKATIHQKTAPDPGPIAGQEGPRAETNDAAFAAVMKGTLTPSMVTLLRGRLDQYDRNVADKVRTDGDPKP